jgi:hypothetical protein
MLSRIRNLERVLMNGVSGRSHVSRKSLLSPSQLHAGRNPRGGMVRILRAMMGIVAEYASFFTEV